MPEFPKRQADILALADAMFAGYLAHGAYFPSVSWMGLFFAIKNYRNAKKAQVNAMALAQVATEAKNLKLDDLEEKMKADLKKSEVDAADVPEKLEYIGWGPKALPSPAEAPGQPSNLDAIIQGAGTVLLDWKSPAHSSGEPVRNYIIERRQQSAGSEFSEWFVVSTSLSHKINLTGQPRGIQLEYRIKAINTGGESPPSNTAAVVL